MNHQGTQVLSLVADYLPPADVYGSLALVNRSLRQLVHSQFPRTVLVTFSHPTPAVSSSEDSKTTCPLQSLPSDSACSKVRLSKITFLPSWQSLPANLHPYVGSSRSGLKVTLESSMASIPQDCPQVKQMMACLRGALYMMVTKTLPSEKLMSAGVPCPKDPNSKPTTECTTDIMPIPWAYTVNAKTIDSELTLYRIQKLLQIFDIRRLEIVEPNEISMRLIKKDLLSLTLSSVLSPIDLTRLASLSQLKQLVLKGPGPDVDLNTQENYDPEELAVLVHLAPTLEHLTICRWFPLSDYAKFMRILGQLVHLKSLKIRGLYQGDQEPHELALLLFRLSKLEHLDQLGHLDKDFWLNFCQYTAKQGHLRLRTFTVEMDKHAVGKVCMEKQFMAVLKLLPALEQLTIKFTEAPLSSNESTPVDSTSPMNEDTTPEVTGGETSNAPCRVKSVVGAVASSFKNLFTESLSCSSMHRGSPMKVKTLLDIMASSFKILSTTKLKTVTVVGLDMTVEAIERMAAFNFSHKTPKVVLRKDPYDD